ncbi:MAG: hypothetical protein AXW15_02755 [Neptuniibacter sp. Phe_28]|nr:MAG: hypothetical protein AXW15_02755 [Neptuniibacter sp. Phe_28]
MTNEYRPIFNRKYLVGLVWFSLIAILILSSMGPGAVEYHDVDSNDSQTLYWMELDDQPMQLVFLLATQPALNTTQQQLQQLKSLILQQRLRALASPTYSYNVTPRQDRIEVTLSWANEQPAPALNRIWQALSKPVDASRWQEPLKKIQARDYLAEQSEEQTLVNRFYQQLQPADDTSVLNLLSPSYAELFTAPLFAISGEDAEDYVELIEQQLPQTLRPTGLSYPDSQPAALLRENSPDKTFRLLLGQTLPPRASDSFITHRISAQVIQDLLNKYQDQHNLNFRILWASLKHIGFQALILEGDQSPGPILPQLQQQVNEELVEQSQNRLAGIWQERMRDNMNQVAALSLIAFYQLPTDTMETYIDQLLDQDPDDIIKQTQRALDASQPISIIQSPVL